MSSAKATAANRQDDRSGLVVDRARGDRRAAVAEDRPGLTIQYLRPDRCPRRAIAGEAVREPPIITFRIRDLDAARVCDIGPSAVSSIITEP